MIKLRWFSLLINLAILLSLTIIYLILNYVVYPSRNAGFFCNDFSISLPFKPSTVNEAWLHVISIVVPFLFLLATEVTKAVYAHLKGSINKRRNAYQLILPIGKEIYFNEFIGNFFINLEYFLFGLVTNASMTSLAKIMIGRLRPNFLSVCKPMENPFIVLCGKNGKTFLVPGLDFECSPSADQKQLEDSRRSFPSGHSSSTFYTMVFLIMFVNKFWVKREIGLLGQFFQVVFFGFAGFVALTRILDNMHHETDVLAGSTLGILVALFTFHYLKNFYALNNYKNKHEIKKFEPYPHEMENFVDNRPNDHEIINLPAIEVRYDL